MSVNNDACKGATLKRRVRNVCVCVCVCQQLETVTQMQSDSSRNNVTTYWPLKFVAAMQQVC